jgi:hypothetical protein
VGSKTVCGGAFAVDLVGLLLRWISWFQILVTFTSVTKPHYPNLEDFKLAIGNLQVGINPTAQLRSRDGASPLADTSLTFVSNNWGDIPQDLVLSLNTPSQLGIYWTYPSTRFIKPIQCELALFSCCFLRYQCWCVAWSQVRLSSQPRSQLCGTLCTVSDQYDPGNKQRHL